jgi:hypothetical protein
MIAHTVVSVSEHEQQLWRQWILLDGGKQHVAGLGIAHVAQQKGSVVHRREAEARGFLQSATVGALRRRAVASTVLDPAAHRMRIRQLRIDRQRTLDGGASDIQGLLRRHRAAVGQRHIRFSKAHMGEYVARVEHQRAAELGRRLS